MSAVNVSVELKNAGELLEGPHWDEKTNTIYYVDIWSGKVHSYNTLTKQADMVKLDGKVGFAIPCTNENAMVVGLKREIVHLDWKTKEVTSLSGPLENEYPENRFNDGKCDTSGRLWAGTMDSKVIEGGANGSLYSLQAKKAIKKHLDNIWISNGLAWSLDNKVMYYIDSKEYSVDAFDFDISSGKISNRRKAIKFPSNSEIFRVPDGMCSDQEGKLWVAIFNGSQVVRVDPETGQQIQVIEFPCRHITSCCFGGPDCSELFVTSCKLTEDDGKEFPLAGSLFKVTGLQTKGFPGSLFVGP